MHLPKWIVLHYRKLASHTIMHTPVIKITRFVLTQYRAAFMHISNFYTTYIFLCKYVFCVHYDDSLVCLLFEIFSLSSNSPTRTTWTNEHFVINKPVQIIYANPKIYKIFFSTLLKKKRICLLKAFIIHISNTSLNSNFLILIIISTFNILRNNTYIVICHHGKFD